MVLKDRYARAYKQYLKRVGEEIAFISKDSIKHNNPDPIIWRLNAIIGRDVSTSYEGGMSHMLEVRYSLEDSKNLQAINAPIFFPSYKQLSNKISKVVIRNATYTISNVALNTFNKTVIITLYKEG